MTSNKKSFNSGSSSPSEDSEHNFELNRLLPSSGLESSKNLSSSAPCAISNQDNSFLLPNPNSSSFNSIESIEMQRKTSKDSALECPTHDDQCRSLSCLSDSTDQSAPVHFDMSNRVS